MQPPQQATIAVAPPFLQRFDNFVVADNLEVVAGLKAAVCSERFAGLWLCGPHSVGKSHLLRASAHHCAQLHRSVFIACEDVKLRIVAALEAAAQSGGLILLDDVGQLAGDEDLEYLLLAVYQGLVQTQGCLVVSHTTAATGLAFDLADLNSRMRSLLHYQVQSLDDEAKADLLRSRANHKGYTLDDAVVAYWLSHGPRDINALLTDLERLDRASLSRKRQVTVPLLKDELGY